MATVHLSTALDSTLEQLAEERGQSKSEVLREAIERLARESRSRTALDRLRPYVGIADSGGRQLSGQTGRRFRELLEGHEPLPQSFFQVLGSWEDDRDPDEILADIRRNLEQPDRSDLE